MKAGFIASAAAHIIILAILLVSFSAPMPMENQQTEEVPITLVPLGDVMNLKQGDAEAPKKEKPAPKPTKRQDIIKPDAENAGESNIDTKMPLKPKEKPREVKAPPPPKGEEASKPQEQPKKAEEQPKKPAEQPKPPKQEEKPAPKPAPAEPKPAEPKPEAPADDIGDILKTETPPKPQETPPKPKEAEQPKAEEKPKPEAPALPETAPVPMPRPPEPKGEKEGAGAADSRNALIDRTRSQGGGAKRSQGEASFGASKNIGSGDNLQQTLNNIIGSCVARNWDIGVIQGSAAYDLRVQMRFRLNQDGSLNGEPDLSPAGGDPKDREVIAVQARTALKKCAPFKLPAEKYSQWHDVTVNMRAFPD